MIDPASLLLLLLTTSQTPTPPTPAPAPAPAPAPKPALLQMSYADDLDVHGLRPARDLKRALRDARSALEACTKADGVVVVDMEVLAAGFVDRVTLVDDAPAAFDGACVVDTIKKLPLPDRGKEPPTRAVIRLVAGAAPAPGTSPADVAAVAAQETDDLNRCVEVARRYDRTLAGTAVAHLIVRTNGSVADVDVDGGTLPSTEARECIAGLLARMRFPGERSVEARVTIPLSFERPSTPPPSDKGAARVVGPFDKPTLFQVIGCASPLP